MKVALILVIVIVILALIYIRAVLSAFAEVIVTMAEQNKNDHKEVDEINATLKSTIPSYTDDLERLGKSMETLGESVNTMLNEIGKANIGVAHVQNNITDILRKLEKSKKLQSMHMEEEQQVHEIRN